MESLTVPLFEALVKAGPYGVALAAVLLVVFACFMIVQQVEKNCLKTQAKIYKTMHTNLKDDKAQLVKLVQDCTTAFTKSTEATEKCTEAIRENGRNATDMSLALKELAIRLELKSGK